jgi:hypothetical protein
MSWGWYQDLWAGVAAGAPWSAPFVNLTSQPASVWFNVVMVAAMSAAFAWMLVAGSRARFVALTTVATAGMMLVQNGLSRSPMVVWYLLPVLPGWVLAQAFLIARLAMSSRAGRFGGVAAGAIILVVWMATTAPIRHAIAETDRQPMRQAAVFAAENLPGALTGAVGVSDRQMLIYDPRVSILKTSDDLDALEQRAAAAGKPIVIFCCGLGETRRRAPDVLGRLERDSYVRADEIPGIEEMFSYHLFVKRR